MDEIFESEVRSSGDFAGVFECDGDTSFFYLYQIEKNGAATVLNAIKIRAGTANFGADDIKIDWDASENVVGLSIKGVVWAAFDLSSQQKYEGLHQLNGTPRVPIRIAAKLK